MKTTPTVVTEALKSKDVFKGIRDLLNQLPRGHGAKPRESLPWFAVDLLFESKNAAAALRDRGARPEMLAAVLAQLDRALIAFEKSMPLSNGEIQEHGRSAESAAELKHIAKAIRKAERRTSP